LAAAGDAAAAAKKEEEEVMEDFKIHQKIIVVIPTAPSPL
jgi:hypothetical protein|tara:strand:- start:13 stop:132 length:120 start_codon:yes stop_codon:yes gene_type:complete